MRHRGFSVVLLAMLASIILAACGGGGTTATPTQAPAAGGGAATAAPAAEATAAPAAEATAAPAAEATAAPAAEATAAPASGGEAATAAPATEAGSTIVVPTNLRTDLSGASVKWIAGAEGPASAWDDAAAKKFTDATGIQVQVIRGQQSATDRLAEYRQQLSAGSGDIDVYQIDVIWPGIMAEFAEDLNPAFPNAKTEHFPAIVENNTVNGALVGIPWFTDAGLLYYRKDLLEKYNISAPPTTWAELETQAKTIQDGERAAGNPDFWGFVWQGKAYEGLTCDALEWQVSNGGGSIVEPDGTISINNEQAAAAFDRAKGWIGTISPEGVTGYQEEEARGVWQAGNSAFMRNWPYAYALGQADPNLKDKFDVMPLPKGDGPNARNADTLGGWQLMVNKNSANKDAAIEFVKYLVSPEVQKSHSIEFANLPTLPALYDDPDILKVNPYYGPLKDVFSGGAVARPSTVTADLYNDVSTAYFTAVNQILTGQKDSKTALADLEGELQSILR
jgi:trehalose/maltose transport system substrate-binding protein